MASDENIFSNLNPKTLGDVSATEINRTTRDVHIERKNLDALKTTVLVNKATFREDGGPIPGTLVIRQVVSNDSGAKFNLDFVEAGEVWILYGFSVADMSGRSGSCTHEVFVADRNNSLTCEIIDYSASSSVFPMHENNWMGPLYVDANAYIAYQVTGTFTDSTMQFISVRVR